MFVFQDWHKRACSHIRYGFIDFLQIIRQKFCRSEANWQMGKKQWTLEEIRLLESIKLSDEQKNWKMISKMFGKKGFRRSQQECRHKWVNCLCPGINHGPWSDTQLSTLYEEYEKNLSRWSVIQKFLPDRTQIKIKNHFYGVLRNIIRFTLKYFKQISGKQTQTSNKVNPNTLKSIYWGQGDYHYMGSQIRDIITLMKYRFNKQILLKIVSENEKLYKKLNDKILQEMTVWGKGSVGASLGCRNQVDRRTRYYKLRPEQKQKQQQNYQQQSQQQLKSPESAQIFNSNHPNHPQIPKPQNHSQPIIPPPFLVQPNPLLQPPTLLHPTYYLLPQPQPQPQQYYTPSFDFNVNFNPVYGPVVLCFGGMGAECP